MKGVEFYNSPDGKVIMQEGMVVTTITQQNSDVIESILDLVKESFIGAYEALDKCYERSKLNVPYHRYQMASRFVRCNCGAYDTLKMDIDDMGRLNLEQVSCPLRGSGDCEWENIICMPKRNTLLSPRQLELAALLSDGYSNTEIADIMCISIATVHNMIQKIKLQLRIKNTGQIVSWYNLNHE